MFRHLAFGIGVVLDIWHLVSVWVQAFGICHRCGYWNFAFGIGVGFRIWHLASVWVLAFGIGVGLGSWHLASVWA